MEGKIGNLDCKLCVTSMWMPHVLAKTITHKSAQKSCFRTSRTVLLFTLIHLGGCRSWVVLRMFKQKEWIFSFWTGQMDPGAALSKHCTYYTTEATVSAYTAPLKQQQSQLSQFTAALSLTRGHCTSLQTSALQELLVCQLHWTQHSRKQNQVNVFIEIKLTWK